MLVTAMAAYRQHLAKATRNHIHVWAFINECIAFKTRDFKKYGMVSDALPYVEKIVKVRLVFAPPQRG